MEKLNQAKGRCDLPVMQIVFCIKYVTKNKAPSGIFASSDKKKHPQHVNTEWGWKYSSL